MKTEVNASQDPVANEGGGGRLAQVAGSVSERGEPDIVYTNDVKSACSRLVWMYGHKDLKLNDFDRKTMAIMELLLSSK